MKAQKRKIEMFTDAESEIYLCAFRYCLGRMSYVVSDFCEEATVKIQRINSHFLLLMEKELSEAVIRDDEERERGERYTILGWDCDKEEWIRFLKIVSCEINRRNLHKQTDLPNNRGEHNE